MSSLTNIIEFQPIDDGTFSRSRAVPMKSHLVEQAAKIVTDPPLLINMVSKRVRQLNQGRPPLVRITGRMGMADIALLEIIEGKIVAQGYENPEDQS